MNGREPVARGTALFSGQPLESFKLAKISRSLIAGDQQFSRLSAVEEIGGENAYTIDTMMSSEIAVQVTSRW